MNLFESDRPSRSHGKQKQNVPDGLVKITDEPNAGLGKKEQEASSGELIEQAKSMQKETSVHQSEEWEDVEKITGSVKGAMKKRSRAVKRRKRRVLSSW